MLICFPKEKQVSFLFCGNEPGDCLRRGSGFFYKAWKYKI